MFTEYYITIDVIVNLQEQLHLMFITKNKPRNACSEAYLKPLNWAEYYGLELFSYERQLYRCR